jgi:hypothetical protein
LTIQNSPSIERGAARAGLSDSYVIEGTRFIPFEKGGVGNYAFKLNISDELKVSLTSRVLELVSDMKLVSSRVLSGVPDHAAFKEVL